MDQNEISLIHEKPLLLISNHKLSLVPSRMSQQPVSFTTNIRKILKKNKLVYWVFNSIKQWSIRRALEAEKHIPMINLKEENIENLKTVTNRVELIKRMAQNKVIAEIGVNRGEFSEVLLKVAQPAKLHLIDSWEGGYYPMELRDLIQSKFKNEIAEGKVELNVGYSTQVLAGLPNHYFDWVFLDTDHSYLLTRDELQVLKQKVKPGGVISGHDYVFGDWFGRKRYGVVEAVNEFCVNEGWEMIYLTCETDEHHSFAIRKIGAAL